MPDDMYLEPPHLTVSIYSDQPEVETFARMCDVAQKFDCVPSNLVDVAPLNQDFELLSDLRGAREVMHPSTVQYARHIAGKEPELRALRAEFNHRKFGRVIVEYLQGIGPVAHPIGLSASAGSLGIPENLWSTGQRRSAYSIADWTRSLLELATLQCNALYGGIGVEFTLLTPWKIKEGAPRFATEIFISRHLIDRSVTLERKLRQAFPGGETTSWNNGLFFSGWAPYNLSRGTVADPAVTSDIIGRALKSALP